MFFYVPLLASHRRRTLVFTFALASGAFCYCVRMVTMLAIGHTGHQNKVVDAMEIRRRRGKNVARGTK